jgi:hypothetical protein
MAVQSTYPKALVLPDNRHDSDKLNITEIVILPTEGEIRSDHPEFLPSTNLEPTTLPPNGTLILTSDLSVTTSFGN